MKDKRIDFAMKVLLSIRREAAESEELSQEQIAEVKAAVRYFTDLILIKGIDKLEDIYDDDSALEHCEAVEAATNTPLWHVLPYFLDADTDAESRARVLFMLHTKEDVVATDARDMTDEERKMLQRFIDFESGK